MVYYNLATKCWHSFIILYSENNIIFEVTFHYLCMHRFLTGQDLSKIDPTFASSIRLQLITILAEWFSVSAAFNGNERRSNGGRSDLIIVRSSHGRIASRHTYPLCVYLHCIVTWIIYTKHCRCNRESVVGICYSMFNTIMLIKWHKI